MLYEVITVIDSRAKANELGATFTKVDKAAFRQALVPLYDDFRQDPIKAKWLAEIESAGK